MNEINKKMENKVVSPWKEHRIKAKNLLDEATKESERLYRGFKGKKKFFEEEEQRERGINSAAYLRGEISKAEYEHGKKEIEAGYKEKIRVAYDEYEAMERIVWIVFSVLDQRAEDKYKKDKEPIISKIENLSEEITGLEAEESEREPYDDQMTELMKRLITNPEIKELIRKEWKETKGEKP